MAASGNRSAKRAASSNPFERLQRQIQTANELFAEAAAAGRTSRSKPKFTQGMEDKLELARTAALKDVVEEEKKDAINKAFDDLRTEMDKALSQRSDLGKKLQDGLDKLKTDLAKSAALGEEQSKIDGALQAGNLTSAGEWIKADVDKNDKHIETERVRQVADGIRDKYAWRKSNDYKYLGSMKYAVWEVDADQQLQKEWNDAQGPVAAEVALGGVPDAGRVPAGADPELEAILRTNARKLKANIENKQDSFFSSPDSPIMIKRDPEGVYSYSACGGLFPHTREWFYKHTLDSRIAGNYLVPLIDNITQSEALLGNPISETNPIKAKLIKPTGKDEYGRDMPYEYQDKDIDLLRKFLDAARFKKQPVIIDPNTRKELVAMMGADNKKTHAKAYIFRALAVTALGTAATAISAGVMGVGLALCGIALAAVAATSAAAALLDLGRIVGRGAAKGIDKLFGTNIMGGGDVIPDKAFLGELWKGAGKLYQTARDDYGIGVMGLAQGYWKNVVVPLFSGARTAARRLTETRGEKIARLLRDYDPATLSAVAAPKPDEAKADPVDPDAGLRDREVNPQHLADIANRDHLEAKHEAAGGGMAVNPELGVHVAKVAAVGEDKAGAYACVADALVEKMNSFATDAEKVTFLSSPPGSCLVDAFNQYCGSRVTPEQFAKMFANDNLGHPAARQLLLGPMLREFVGAKVDAYASERGMDVGQKKELRQDLGLLGDHPSVSENGLIVMATIMGKGTSSFNLSLHEKGANKPKMLLEDDKAAVEIHLDLGNDNHFNRWVDDATQHNARYEEFAGDNRSSFVAKYGDYAQLVDENGQLDKTKLVNNLYSVIDAVQAGSDIPQVFPPPRAPNSAHVI